MAKGRKRWGKSSLRPHHLPKFENDAFPMVVRPPCSGCAPPRIAIQCGSFIPTFRVRQQTGSQLFTASADRQPDAIGETGWIHNFSDVRTSISSSQTQKIPKND